MLSVKHSLSHNTIVSLWDRVVVLMIEDVSGVILTNVFIYFVVFTSYLCTLRVHSFTVPPLICVFVWVEKGKLSGAVRGDYMEG